jgi:predicted P-loop ATPase
MRDLKIAYGNSCYAVKWSNKTITFNELCQRLVNTIRTPETAEEYPNLPKKERDRVKDKGGFVGGALKGGRRKSETVVCRSMLTHDTDHAEEGFVARYESGRKYASALYTTHGHTPEAPRLRIITPLTRDVTPDEYTALSRYFAAEWGIDQFDRCSYLPQQLMYWPSTPSNGEYIFRKFDGDWLDPDEYLAKHPNWRDFSQLPTSSKESEVRKQEMKRQADPLAKSGVVGAFCNAYLIEDAIEAFLSDIYEASAVEGRYDYIPADSAAGVVIYDDKWLFSHHASDPANGRLLNAFDVVRIHKYGDLDEKASYTAMAEFAVKDERVGVALLEERRQKAAQDFVDWEHGLQRAKNGNLLNNLYNVQLILENDPALQGLVFNELADSMEVKGEVPWNRPAGVLFWRDADDAQLTCYLDAQYGSFSARHILNAMAKVVDDRSYHPIRERLEVLPPWDLVPRAETVFIDYLGAEDNPYVRAVTRKTLCAAVQRVKYPGIKFDHMLVLDGNQGIGKSTLLYKLGGAWFSDSLSLSDLVDSKTAAEKLQGQWLLEISELEGMNKADVNRVKAFISRQDDKYRAAYGRRVTPHPRQCVIIGTINPDKGYLRDTTGNRRFWPIVLSGNGAKKSWQLTDGEVKQIWAEVLVLAESEKLYLDTNMEKLAQLEQRGAIEQDEREGLVRDYLAVLLPDKWDSMDIYERREYVANPNDPTQPEGTNPRTAVCCLEIWCECFGNKKESITPRDSSTIRAIMARIEGWERQPMTKHHKHYGSQRFYDKT